MQFSVFIARERAFISFIGLCALWNVLAIRQNPLTYGILPLITLPSFLFIYTLKHILCAFFGPLNS